MIVQVDNINYNVEITGSGYPIVCLHGFAEDSTTWEYLKLDGYSLYKVDLIGHGKTEKPEQKEYYEIRVVLTHLNVLIRELIKTNYSILGYSMGGRIALAYTLHYTNEVDKLILESASYGIEDREKRYDRYKSDRLLARAIMDNGIAWFQEYWSGLTIFNTQKALSEETRLEIKRRRLQNKEWALANALLGIGQGAYPCLKNEISRLSMPVLYVCGQLDQTYSAIGQKLQMLNPNVQCIPIKNAGHNVHLEQKKKYESIIKSFLDSKV